MLKLKTLFILVLLGPLAGCLHSEQKPTLSPAELESALLKSEDRLSQNWRQMCNGIIDQQLNQQASLNELASSQTSTSRQLQILSEKLDKVPEPVVVPRREAPVNCPTVKSLPSLDNKIILGRTEWILIETVNRVFRARVDSGATTSSLSAHHIIEFERDGKKWVRFNMVPDDDIDDSYEVEAPLIRFARIRQASSETVDRRPVVALTIKVGDFTDTAEFTLADRSAMTYPILLGREFLRDIALIDVAKSYYQPKPEPLKDRPESAPDTDVENDN